jgi:multiple sugar transport system permease protein
MKASKTKKRISNIIFNLITISIAIAFLFPYLFMVTSAFKNRLDTFAYPPIWVFFKPTLENFKAIFEDVHIGFYMVNSLIVASFSSILTMIIAIPATYAIARFQFKFKETITYGFLFLQMVPGISIVFALFYIARALNLYDTYFYLSLVYLLWNIPYAIWMLRGFVEAIPVDLEESAMVDGCTRFRAFRAITLPLMSSGLIATTILIFIGAWNEFQLAFFLTSTKSRTLPTTIAFFMTHSGVKWGEMFATAAIGTLPVVFFAILVRRYFIAAMTYGAVKG